MLNEESYPLNIIQVINFPEYLTLVTTFGIKENDQAKKLVANNVTMDYLFH